MEMGNAGRLGRLSLAARAAAVAAALLALAVPAAHALNDACADALPIGNGMFAGTTSAATNDGPGSCGESSASPDVWYVYSATEDGLLDLELCGSSYDTVLSVWSGCPGSGAELECNDEGCGLQSSLFMNMEAGQDYYIRVSGWNGASGSFTLSVQGGSGCGGAGPDVIYSEIAATSNFGMLNGIRAYALQTNTCNVGDEDLMWGTTGPLLGMNAYRLHEGRLEQIGMSFVKNGTSASALPGCGIPCNDHGGGVLGAGCSDIYFATFNGFQSILGPRSTVNAFTGQYPGPTVDNGNAIYERLQIRETDLGQSGAGALYFVEGQYVAFDDAACGNAMNNASYKRVVVTPTTFNLTPAGSIALGVPAIYAWRDHGNGAGMPDDSVRIVTTDVPDEGRFHVAAKVSETAPGTWRYEYAVRNFNSHRSAGAFSVPVPPSRKLVVSNAGFHDVDYHSGEPYDATDWTITFGASSVRWSSPQTHAENPNTNALRFATMYNFWFDANVPPADGEVTVHLFRPGTPASVTAAVQVPANECPADLDGDGEVGVGDLVALILTWGECLGCAADLDGDGEVGVGDLVDLITGWGPCGGGA